MRDGVALLTWTQDSFGYAESFDEAASRYRGLRGGQQVAITDLDAPGVLVKPEVARVQLDAEAPRSGAAEPAAGPSPGDGAQPSTGAGGRGADRPAPTAAPKPRRYFGTVQLDALRVGRDASRIAEELIAHLAALPGAEVTVTLEVQANIPNGAPDHVVRTVTENARTLKFGNQGFESE